MPSERARHRENFDDGQGQRIADQHIGAELMEIIGHERRRGGGRAEGREQQPQGPPPQQRLYGFERHAFALAFDRAGSLSQRLVTAPRGHPRFIDGNQGRHRRERQLEARAHDRFRLDQNDKRRGDREIAHGQRLPVEQNRSQHD